MTKISLSTHKAMAKALVQHKFNTRADELSQQSTALFNAVLDERYDAQTQKLMKQLDKLHPGAFKTKSSIYLRANGMRVQVGSMVIGDWDTVRWSVKSAERPVIATVEDAEPSQELAYKIAAFSMATKEFAEEVASAYSVALGTLRQFTTVERLQEWPEALPVIGGLIPTEDRTLPVVQLNAINEQFDLPPAEAA